MRGKNISIYCPALSGQELLEDLLVVGKKTVTRITEAAVADASSGSRHYRLLVGPAGAGKSHMLAVARKRLADQVLSVLLPHEVWGISSCNALLERVLEQLPAVGDVGDDPVERIRRAAAGRVIVMFVEDLAGLFSGLGEGEQLRFRAFLQQEKLCAIFAAAREVFPAVADREAPFFGFFRVEHVEEPGLEGATRLVRECLEAIGQSELGEAFSKDGQAGLRAFIELFGQRPRYLVHLAQCMAEHGVGDPLPLLPMVLERMTPAFLAMVERLSPQQRKLLECLVRCPGSLQVKEVAALGEMSEQTASAQLRVLKEGGLVAVHRNGRSSFYELADPLMRNCLLARWGSGGELAQAVGLLQRYYQGGPFPVEVVAATMPAGPVKDLVAEWGKKGDLAGLALGLILARGKLLDPMVSATAAEAWVGLWSRVAEEEIRLAARLVEACFREGRLDNKVATLGLPAGVRGLLGLLPLSGD